MLDHASAEARPPGRTSPGPREESVARRTLSVSAGETEGEAVAERLRARVDVVFFRAGEVLFAVLAEGVEQVQHLERGELPALDLAAEMGRRAERDIVLVLRVGDGRLRLRIDEALEVAAVPLEDFHPLPPVAAAAQRGGYVEGLVVRGDELAILVDARALAATAHGTRAVARVADAAR